LLLLALRNLRARIGRTLFTAFAIALGMALIFATRIVNVAADGSALYDLRPALGESICCFTWLR